MIMRVFGVLCIAFSVVLAWAWVDYHTFLAQSVVKESPLVIDIQKGSSFRSIIQNVLDQKRPADRFWFKLLAHQQGLIKQLKAGEYELAVGMTPPQFLALLSQGKVRQHSITFPEGWTFKQMRKALAQDSYIQQTFNELSDIQVLQKMGVDSLHPEGLFFPDTYSFEKQTTDLAILQRAYQKMQRVLAEQWANKSAELPLKSAYEALILASIVEKETGIASERPMIAGVFIRRLRQGMRLQTDPTVIYGMGDSYQGNIRKKDLMLETPYNTYRIKGLPPTPIAMPGERAIQAVLHPSQGNNVYFVAKGDGSHVFSASLEAHNRAVNFFQRNRK